MLDLYINYDCDVQCTNLFETICKALARQATPPAVAAVASNQQQPAASAGAAGALMQARSVGSGDGDENDGELNALHRLALEGVLAVIESIARRCHVQRVGAGATTVPGISLADADAALSAAGLPGPPSYPARSISTDTDVLSEFGGDAIDGELKADGSAEAGTVWLAHARARTAQVLQQRKELKRKLSLAAETFNAGGKKWVQEVQKIGLLPSTDDAAAVASFLLKTPGLDKALIGEYISKGPVDRYPFNSEVLKEFCTSFSFAGTQFDTALRTFLLAFRLPGEAQCIDRLMEAFSAELFKQWRDHEAATRGYGNDPKRLDCNFGRLPARAELGRRACCDRPPVFFICVPRQPDVVRRPSLCET